MPTLLRVILSFGILILTACGPVHLTLDPRADALREVKKLAVVVADDGSFTVIRERATATGAPAALFGLVGAAVAAAYNAQLDRSAAEALSPHLGGFSSRSELAGILARALKESARFSEVQMLDQEPTAAEARKYDAVLTIRIVNWGLRAPAPTESARLAAFAELQIRMVRVSNSETLWEEQDTVVGQGRYGLATYQQDRNLLRQELQDTIEKAGYRVATQLLYPKEGKR